MEKKKRIRIELKTYKEIVRIAKREGISEEDVIDKVVQNMIRKIKKEGSTNVNPSKITK